MFYKIMCLVNTFEKASTGRRLDIFTRLSHAPGESRLPVRLIMSSFTPLSELCLGDASASASPPPPCACLRGKPTYFPLETPPKGVSSGEASSHLSAPAHPWTSGTSGEVARQQNTLSRQTQNIFFLPYRSMQCRCG